MGLFSLNWSKGRQDSGYKKIKLFVSKQYRFDCYLIKYEKGDFIPKHKDNVDDKYIHNRINVLLKKADKGGEFYCDNYKIFLNRIIFFQASEEIHSVSKIEKGTRLILSIGWLTKK